MSQLLNPEDVPHEVVKAACTLEKFFGLKGCYEWQLLGVCSRNHAYRLENALEKLKAYERLVVSKQMPSPSR